MKIKNFKKLFLILAVFGFVVLFFGTFALAQPIEEVYPQVPGAEAPTTVKAFLPGYIQYLFNLAIIIAGIIAFASLVYGGFRYLASAGNPTAMSDARGQITAGILGLVILITSYLILIQINPELIVLKIGKIEFAKGVILYAASDCPGGDTPQEGSLEGEDFLRARTNYSWLGDDFSNKARSMYVYNSSDELEIKLFSDRNYENLFWETAEQGRYGRGECFNISPTSESIQLIWKLPGVYLFTDAECKEEPHLFISSISDFAGIGLHDKAKSIKIIPWIEMQSTLNPACAEFLLTPNLCTEHPECCVEEPVVRDKLGAVLHEHNNFHGDAEVFFGGDINGDSSLQLGWCLPLDGGREEEPCINNVYDSYCREAVGTRASAITIFSQRPPGSPSPTGGITLYSNYFFNEENGEDENRVCGPFPNSDIFRTQPQWIDRNSGYDCGNVLGDTKGSSIRVEGDYIAVLFRDDGRGEVFKENDLRLKDNHIGDDKVKFMLVIPVIKRGI